MLLVIVLALKAAADCEVGENEADLINPGCNYAGMCWNSRCFCCVTTDPDNFCKGAVPGDWNGDNCEQVTYYTQVTWGYLLEGSDVACDNDGTPATPDLLNQTTEVLRDGYVGEIMAMACEVCTPENPCTFFQDDPVADYGIFVKFGTDINTFYDWDCSKGSLPENIRPCEANWDYGTSGYLAMVSALDKENSYAQYKADIEELLMSDGEYGLSWPVDTNIRIWNRYFGRSSVTVQTTRLPTPSPTPEPTSIPTPLPTEFDAQEEQVCKDYINQINDLKFVGAGSSCRANINESWVGGRSCASPYITCLPQENTPATDIMGDPYKSTTHRYSVSECLQECTYDQRCLGIEFVADTNSVTGNCSLIDDIPLAVDNPEYGYTYNENDQSLDSDTTGASALCWAKNQYCNPYFEAEDLNDDMLNCYCPNNRKGLYTKKVKRIVNNTRYCYDDSSVEQRIKKAQANRMFHLCENWCLFETLNPQRANWYWDPWKTCWRETYSGTGVHRGYCDRVIRNPDSIELKFVTARSDNFLSCDASAHPTSAPISDTSTWVLAALGDSCDDACNGEGKVCAEEHTAQIFGSEAELINAFAEAGHTCESSQIRMESVKFEGWALPGLRNSNLCANRLPTLSHLEDLDTDCSRKLGGLWQRLCACY